MSTLPTQCRYSTVHRYLDQSFKKEDEENIQTQRCKIQTNKNKSPAPPAMTAPSQNKIPGGLPASSSPQASGWMNMSEMWVTDHR